MTTVRDMLETRIKNWAFIGHPAIMERFVLRNGREFTPKALTGKRMRSGECFQNVCAALDRGTFPGGEYIEGYGVRKGFGDYLVHHAWVGVGDEAIDVTWKPLPEDGYFGVAISLKDRAEQQLKTGYYPILDTPATMINLDYIFTRDPALKPIIEEIIGQPINLKETA